MSGARGSGGDTSSSHDEEPLVDRDEKDTKGPSKDAKQWTAEVEEVAKHNSALKACKVENSQKLRVDFLEDNLPHIFEPIPRKGHLPDTPENRALLLEVASDLQNYFAKPDKRGNMWCEKILSDGTQLWAQVRNGKIRNGGLNSLPIKWDPETGLSRNIKNEGVV
jgi:hypothetical protein